MKLWNASGDHIHTKEWFVVIISPSLIIIACILSFQNFVKFAAELC
jgi:hypothetical protein